MPYYKGSWYSQLPAFGWFDPQDRPGSAAYQVGGRSIPDSQQGIALPSRAGLGKWYNVTPPGGGLPFPMQQTDVGPAKWTGRGVDVSAAAAHQMGYTPKSFPTDAAWKIEPRDEPRGLGSPAGMPVQAGDIPDNTDETAIASGPPERQGRKMPSSLMDMFQPQNVAGEPVGFGDALRGNANAMVGLGMGLLQPYRPGESPYTAALQGYQTGSAADSRRGFQQAQLQHQRRQEGRQAANDAFQRQQALLDRDLRERQFARGDITDAQRAMKDVLGPDAAPEQKADFMRKYYEPKTEGDWVVQTDPNSGTTYQLHKRTGETRAVQVPGGTAPTNPYAPGGKMTTDEGKTALFADRAATAHDVITRHENLNEGVAGKIGGGVEMTLPAGVTNMIVSPERALAMNAKRAFVNSLLRRESGAAISSGEFASYDKEYFPQPGDSQEQIDFKRKHRAEVIAGLARESGKGYRPDYTFSDTGHMTRTGTTPGYAGKGQGTPTATEATPTTAPAPPVPSEAAIRALKQNPQRRDEFDAKYGAGAAMRVLTGK